MSEPINPTPHPEGLKPKQLIIGETPIYLSTPLTIDGTIIEEFKIFDSDTRASAISGIGTATILMKEPSRKQGERGTLIDKPLLHTNNMDPVEWDKVSGIRYTDANNELHDISKDQLRLDPTSPAEAGFAGQTSEAPIEQPVAPEEPVVDILEASQKQKEKPILARAVLETLKEDPNTITIVGLKAYEVRARDLAARKMQTIVTPAHKDMSEAQNKVWEKTKDTADWFKNLGRTVWKQSVGGTYFQERARQYYMDMLKAAETPFAEDAIKIAETRAKATYDKLLADKNFLTRAGTKAVEWAKDALGMRTMIEKFALQELGNMKVAGEIKGIESFEREAKAVRMRFSQDMDKADIFVRRNLGEKLDILDPTIETNKPLIDGIKGLMREYATGEIVDKKSFDEKAKEFFKTTLKDAQPNTFAEAELYSSSLFDAAETLRAKREHIGGIEAINAELDAMTIRLGLAQMGEVTSIIPSHVEGATKKILDIAEWIESKGIPLRPMLFNEATIGTGVALALTGVNIFKTMPLTRFGLGAIAGGTFAGFREYGAIQRDYLTHLREREAGDTFSESMKRRNFFEKYLVNQRSAEDMIGKIQSSLYEPDGTMKVILTDDELRMGMATITDITARKAVSEAPAIKKMLSPDKRIGLIRFSERESIETQRTALDVTSHKALTDIETYLSTHTEQAASVLGDANIEDFMVKLTTNQTTVLKDGANTLANIADDPIRNVLGLVAEHAPEINILKRRFPLGGRALPPEQQILGMDAILDQFTRDARVEAVKYGIKSGAIGAVFGAAMHGLGEVFIHKVPDVAHAVNEHVTNINTPAHFTPDVAPANASYVHTTPPFGLSSPTPDHTIIIDGKTYELPSELHIETVKQGFGGGRQYSAMLDFTKEYSALHNQPDIDFGRHLTTEQLKTALDKAGVHMFDAHAAGEALGSTHSVDIPNLVNNGHQVTMQLPPGYSIQPEPDHTYAIIFDNHHVVDNIKFNPDGSLASPLTLPPNLHFDAGTTHDIPIKNIGHIPDGGFSNPETAPLPTGDMTIDGDKLGNGGIWDYFLGKAHDENAMATANGMKNLFRLYEHQNGTQNIHFGTNHDGTWDNPYNHVIHTRDAHFGDTFVPKTDPHADIDLNRIANDAHFTNLDEHVFGQTGIDAFAKIQHDALIDYKAILADPNFKGGPLTAVQQMLDSKDPQQHLEAIALKLGFIGNDGQLPTDHDVSLLMHHMAGTASSPPTGSGVADYPDWGARDMANRILSGEAGPTTKIHEIVISKVYTDSIATNHIGANSPLVIPYMTASDVEKIATGVADKLNYPDWGERDMANRLLTQKLESSLPWLPVFVPYRSSLEREFVPPPETSPINALPTEFLSPYGNEGMYLTREQINERKSPRLSENPDAELRSNEEIAWYLSTLSQDELQTNQQLNAQHDIPMANEVTRVVAIPTTPENASHVYQTLTQYTTQTDPAGAPLDPKQTEIVLLNRVTGVPVIEGETPEPAADQMKIEIDRFKADHPEFSVVYLTKEYPEATSYGQHKRDLSNGILSRIAARGETSGDVAIINAFIESGDISNTYLSTISTTLENPLTDVVHGMYKQPQEAYEKFPMLFASLRLQELFDGMVRHGQSTHVPNVISGNMAVKASTLAAVGGYNANAAAAEDRELVHIIKSARNDKEGTIATHDDLIQTINPKDALYQALQRLGVATEEDKSLTWQELAAKVSENLPKDHLTQSINQLYQNSYPTLKAQNPELFDAYFGRSLDALGLSYEIVDGNVTILDDSGLASNVAAELDIEEFTKTAAEDVRTKLHGEVTSNDASLSPRETLENVAGKTDEQINETETIKQEEAATLANQPVAEPPLSSPDIEQVAQTISVETPAVTPEPINEPQVEILPEGITDRINYSIGKHEAEGQTTVEMTPNELMDYVKSTVSVPNGRITEGSLSIENNTVQLTNVTIQTPLGKGTVTATMIDDPKTGLNVDPNSLDTHLDFLLRGFGGQIKDSANTLTDKIKTHFNEKITDPNWESGVMHVTGDKISLTFIKKTTT